MYIIKSFLPAIMITLLCIQVHAQQKRWTVKPGESIGEVLGNNVLYRYPQFNPGVVRFKNGTVSRAPLNLNFITGEMQFINSSRDTLTIANENSIDYITIQADTFYFNKIYIELIHSNTTAKLGKVVIIRLTDIQKEGAFGQMSSTSSIDNVSYFYGGSQTYKLAQKSAITLEKKTVYFIGNNDNDFLPAAKKNFNKMFSQKSSAIETFIKQNKIALNKQNDLLELVDFLGKI